MSKNKSSKLKRVPLSIPGLDELMQGGIPHHSSVFVGGQPGAGKTTFVLQVAMSRIREGQRVAYITSITEPFSMIVEYGSTYDFFDPDSFISNTRFYNISGMMDVSEFIQKLDEVANSIVKEKFDLIIIDPITVFVDYLDPRCHRIMLDEFLSKMRMCGNLTLMTGELQHDRELTISIEAYLSDGIIILTNQLEIPVRKRYIEIVKMRGTRHSNSLHPFVIEGTGLNVG